MPTVYVFCPRTYMCALLIDFPYCKLIALPSIYFLWFPVLFLLRIRQTHRKHVALHNTYSFIDGWLAGYINQAYTFHGRFRSSILIKTICLEFQCFKNQERQATSNQKQSKNDANIKNKHKIT